MKISRTVQKKLQKLPQNAAQAILADLNKYEQTQRGYIRWLEGRAGYRIRINDTHIVFDLVENEIHALDMFDRG